MYICPQPSLVQAVVDRQVADTWVGKRYLGMDIYLPVEMYKWKNKFAQTF